PPQFQIAHDELAGYIDASAGDVKKGLAELDRAARAESQLPYTDPTVYPRPVLELLGKTALKAGDFRTAESAYRRALENEPGSGRALLGLSKALEGLGKKQEAEETLNKFRRVWRGEELSSPPQRRSRGTASFRRGTAPLPAKGRGVAAKIGSTNSLKPLRPIFSSSRAEEGKADAVAAAGVVLVNRKLSF